MLSTKVMLKIILSPEEYLLADTEEVEPELVYVDLIQLIQDNLLESALNPKYVAYHDVEQAMECIEQIITLPSEEPNTACLEKICIHFFKMCFVLNFILKQKNYPQVQVLPTFSGGIADMITKTVNINNSIVKSWQTVGSFQEMAQIFNEFAPKNNAIFDDDKTWKLAILGSISREFPKSLTTLDFSDTLDKVLQSSFEREDAVATAILQSIYLMENYGLYVLVVPQGNSDKDDEEVRRLEATNL